MGDEGDKKDCGVLACPPTNFLLNESFESTDIPNSEIEVRPRSVSRPSSSLCFTSSSSVASSKSDHKSKFNV
jgi:hypothetical protein